MRALVHRWLWQKKAAVEGFGRQKIHDLFAQAGVRKREHAGNICDGTRHWEDAELSFLSTTISASSISASSSLA